MLEKLKIKRIDLRNKSQQTEDVVAIETPLTIILNDQEFTTLLCSPLKLKELAIGYLTAEGFISKFSDLISVVLDERTNIVRVKTTNQVNKNEFDKKRIITSGCGRGQTFYNYRDFSNCSPIITSFNLQAKILLNIVSEFQKKSETFKETGGVHSAALCEEDRIICFCEDIGRHNAVDKIIGEMLLKEESIQNKFLVTSGRISSEIAIKAARLSVPLIASPSAPTSQAVKIAKQLKITLIGFARGYKMNVYSEEERIVNEE